MEKWWDNPTAAVGALMGEKAQAMAECQIAKKLQAEYERGLQEGREGAVVHAHWKHYRINLDLDIELAECSNCGETAVHYRLGCIESIYKYCPSCGAKMDEEGAE